MLTNRIPSSLYCCSDVRQIDLLAIQSGVPGIQLMKRAGRALFEVCQRFWPDAKRYLVFCGAGNNGGDGYVFAAIAAQKRIPVKVIALSNPDSLGGDAQLAHQYALQENVEILDAASAHWQNENTENAVVLDALLGTGFSGSIRENYKEAIDWINDSGCNVVAADLPSGLNGDTGYAETAVNASATVTFVGCKRGLLTGRGATLSGDIWFDDLDISANVYEKIPPTNLRVTTANNLKALKPRSQDAHKGLFGHVMVVGGDVGYGGAAAMAAEAALFCGAGLVSVATQPQNITPILTRVPEVMVNGVTSGQELQPLLTKPSVIVIGPGLGASPWSEQMLQQVLSVDCPLVVDADALNLIATGKIGGSGGRNNWIMTPHPGEASRLLGLKTSDIQQDRFSAAEKIQQRYQGVCILKGAGSLVATANGVSLAKVGNPGMAAGGMGDILAGIIGALIAQGLTLEIASELGVCVHGDAGDMAAEFNGQRGLRATELIPYAREILNSDC